VTDSHRPSGGDEACSNRLKWAPQPADVRGNHLIDSMQVHLMKYATLALFGIGLAIGPVAARGQAPTKGEAELKTLEQKASYTIGLNIGKSMKEQGVDLDPDIIARGLRDGLGGRSAMTDQQIMEAMQAFQQKMLAKQGAGPGGAATAANPAEADKNQKEGQAFLAANKSKPGVQVLPSGLQYKVLKAGTGKTPVLSDTVVANYRGTLIDGTEFDSSAKTGGPVEFPVGGVIKGWTEILQKMKVGDKYQVFIPSELAYGARQIGRTITPNSTLIFDIELVDVK